MKILSMLVTTSWMLLLNGCFKAETPKCSDTQVVGMVKEIYVDHMKTIELNDVYAQFLIATVPKNILKIDSQRAVGYDENIGLRTCKAQAYFDNDTLAPIEYTVQLDEKNNEQFYVELKLDFLEDLVERTLMNQVMDNIK